MGEQKPTLKPNSPGFSGSKSYTAVQCGPLGRFCCSGGGTIGVRAGERIGDGNGEAARMRLRNIRDRAYDRGDRQGACRFVKRFFGRGWIWEGIC